MQVRDEQSSSLACIPEGHLHGVIYTRLCIDTIDSPGLIETCREVN